MGVASKIKLTSFDSLFGDDTNTSNGITEVKISELRSFKDHPFKVVDDDKKIHAKSFVVNKKMCYFAPHKT